jgi:hypothetical protein
MKRARLETDEHEAVVTIHSQDQVGGGATMLGQWRIVLRQAEEAARAGRFDEALALASRPDVADYRQAVQLRGRLTLELLGRAGRRAQSDDISGAVADLALAEVHGAPPDALATARLKLAEQVADEVRAGLVAGDPARVVEQVDALARHRVSGPALRRMREAADTWQSALNDLRKGEFGQARDALERAGRLAGDAAAAALATARRDLDSRQQAAGPRVERLYAALGGSAWAEILAAADAVLDVLPDHQAARQARGRAWQQLGALSPSAERPRRAGPATPLVEAPAQRPPAPQPGDILYIGDVRPDPAGPGRPAGTGHDRFLLWADGIGGFLVCTGDEVVLGRASPDGQADVPLLGDLSRRHATLVRSGDGYLLRAHHPTYLNNRKVDAAALRNGDVIRLGASVEVEFHQPSPVSATARLEIVSRHRLPVAVDGVILMAETCLMGPSSQAHIPAPHLEAPVVLYRQGTSLWCKAPGRFEVDGRPHATRAPLSPRASVIGQGYSFSLEPLAPRLSQA